jgi:hypothetical protein
MAPARRPCAALLCPGFPKVRFLESGDLNDDLGGRSWRGRGMRRSFAGGHSIWSRRRRPLRRSRGCSKLSDRSIYSWRRQALIDRGESPGLRRYFAVVSDPPLNRATSRDDQFPRSPLRSNASTAGAVSRTCTPRPNDVIYLRRDETRCVTRATFDPLSQRSADPKSTRAPR